MPKSNIESFIVYNEGAFGGEFYCMYIILKSHIEKSVSTHFDCQKWPTLLIIRPLNNLCFTCLHIIFQISISLSAIQFFISIAWTFQVYTVNKESDRLPQVYAYINRVTIDSDKWHASQCSNSNLRLNPQLGTYHAHCDSWNKMKA